MTEDDAILQLAATLLPGGVGFPAATDTGMAAPLLQRLRQADPTAPARLLAALSGHGGPPADTAAWTSAASRLEAMEPVMFTELRRQAYLAYYEEPAVIQAIRNLGHPYNDAPLPDGYPVAAFDPARDAPRHGRGRWVDTDDIRPVDLAGLGWRA